MTLLEKTVLPLCDCQPELSHSGSVHSRYLLWACEPVDRRVIRSALHRDGGGKRHSSFNVRVGLICSAYAINVPQHPQRHASLRERAQDNGYALSEEDSARCAT